MPEVHNVIMGGWGQQAGLLFTVQSPVAGLGLLALTAKIFHSMKIFCSGGENSDRPASVSQEENTGESRP